MPLSNLLMAVGAYCIGHSAHTDLFETDGHFVHAIVFGYTIAQCDCNFR